MIKPDKTIGCFLFWILLLLCSCSAKGDTNVEKEPEYTAPAEGQYDTILAQGDGYYLVSKWHETYQEAYMEYGVILHDGQWLIPLSATNQIAEAANSFNGYERTFDLKFNYLGEGMFLISKLCCLLPERIESGYAQEYNANGSSRVFNAETGKVFDAGWIITPYYNGFTFTRGRYLGPIIRMDQNGNSKMVADTKEVYWGLPSQGLIYIDKKFYDVKTAKESIDLSEFDIYDAGTMQFDEKGYYYFEFYNPAGTKYCATIDTNGAFIEEPHKK